MTTFTSHSSRLALPVLADSFFFLSVSHVQTPIRTCAVTDTPHKGFLSSKARLTLFFVTRAATCLGYVV